MIRLDDDMTGMLRPARIQGAAAVAGQGCMFQPSTPRPSVTFTRGGVGTFDQTGGKRFTERKKHIGIGMMRFHGEKCVNT